MDNTEQIRFKEPIKYFTKENPRVREFKEKPIGKIISSQLLPFRNTMKLQLRRHGYDTTYMSFESVIPLYYNEFVAGEKLTPIDRNDFINNPTFKIRPSDNLNGEISGIHKDYFNQINDVVYNIIQTFKISRDKKHAAGVNYMEVLTNDELIQAKTADKVQQELQLKLLGATSITVDDIKSILLMFLGFYLAYLLIDAL